MEVKGSEAQGRHREVGSRGSGEQRYGPMELRLSFAGSEDGEAETETCRAAKPSWLTTIRTLRPVTAQSLNLPRRNRQNGVVAVERGRPLPPVPRVARIALTTQL